MTVSTTEVEHCGETVPQLSGPQKVAVLIIALGRERSAPILSRLRENEIDEVANEIVRMRTVAPESVAEVLNEFEHTMVTGQTGSGGGIDVAHNLLAGSLGAARADAVLDRLAEAQTKNTQPFAFLIEAQPRALVTFLAEEHPQTIALVLAHLPMANASLVLGGLPPQVQSDVAHRIGVMESSTPEMVRIVAETLQRKTSSVLQPGATSATVGGLQPLVDIINRADPATEKLILESLQARDPELAEAVRSKLFVFSDITTLEDRGVQLVLRQVESADLAVALKGVSEPVRDKVLSNVSDRARENLLEEIELLGPTRVSAVEEARAKVVQVIRSLEETGQIVLRRGGSDDEFVD